MSDEFDVELDPESWDEAERFWPSEVDTLAIQPGQTGDWQHFYSKYYGDGVTLMPREDRPVCDGRSWDLDRGLTFGSSASSDRSGSVIYTDGLNSYKGLDKLGYTHHATAISQGDEPAHVVLPAVHRVASLVKRWLMGTHHGGWGAQHAQAYLDEFVFRFNRRTSKARGLLFYRLLQNAVVMRKTTYATLVLSRRADSGKRRGVARTRGWSNSAITGVPASD
jgi:hypothetical protein